MKRRDFLMAAAFGGVVARAAANASDNMSAEIVEYTKPVFNLHKFFDAALKITAIDLLTAHKQYFLRTRTADGGEGIVQVKNIEDYVPILANRVRPFFMG